MFISAIRAMCCNAATSGSVCLKICYLLGIAVHFILAINYDWATQSSLCFPKLKANRESDYL